MNSRAAGATASSTGMGDRLRSWMRHHRIVALGSIRELASNPAASAMTWLMIGIALALPAMLYVLLLNVSEVSGDWGGKPRVSLYLVHGATDEAAQALSRDIGQEAGVASATFISRSAALEEFQMRSGFGEALSTLDRNPLPHVIEVISETADPALLAARASQWEANELVDGVSVDLEWIERLFAFIKFSERLLIALALVLATGVALVMGNTIRLAILSRRQEIEIIKLVGGTDSFARRPFLYLGFWYGFGGAVTALLLIQASMLTLAGPVEALARSYGNDFVLSGPGFAGSLAILLGGALLGVLGASLAVGRHLGQIEPA